MNLIARPNSSASRHGLHLAVALLLAGGLGACGNGIERADHGSDVVLTDEDDVTIEPASSEQVAAVRNAATAYQSAAGIEVDMTISMGSTEFMEANTRMNQTTDPTAAVGEMTMSMPMMGADAINAVFTDGTMYMQMGGEAIGPNGETWFSMPMQDAIASGATVDPNQTAGALQSLEEAGDVKFVGNDEIDGEPVEVYEFSASGESWADLSKTSGSADASAVLEGTEIAGTVSITEEGEARAMTVNVDMGAMLAEVPEDEIDEMGGTSMTIEMTMRPIDETITVSPPPADQVVDAEEVGFDPSSIGG